MSDGLHFVGLDLIGNKLLEVNVLNPGGITNINRLNRLKLERKVIDYVEQMVDARHAKRSELELRLTQISELRRQLAVGLGVHINEDASSHLIVDQLMGCLLDRFKSNHASACVELFGCDVFRQQLPGSIACRARCVD